MAGPVKGHPETVEGRAALRRGPWVLWGGGGGTEGRPGWNGRRGKSGNETQLVPTLGFRHLSDPLGLCVLALPSFLRFHPNVSRNLH